MTEDAAEFFVTVGKLTLHRVSAAAVFHKVFAQLRLVQCVACCVRQGLTIDDVAIFQHLHTFLNFHNYCVCTLEEIVN